MYTVATLVFPVHLRWCVHRNNNNNNNNNNIYTSAILSVSGLHAAFEQKSGIKTENDLPNFEGKTQYYNRFIDIADSYSMIGNKKD